MIYPELTEESMKECVEAREGRISGKKWFDWGKGKRRYLNGNNIVIHCKPLNLFVNMNNVQTWNKEVGLIIVGVSEKS